MSLNANQQFNLDKYNKQVGNDGNWTFTKKLGYKCTTDNCSFQVSPATIDYYLNLNKDVTEFKCYHCQELNK